VGDIQRALSARTASIAFARGPKTRSSRSRSHRCSSSVLVVGIVVLLIGVAILVTGSRRSSTTVENVQSTSTGQEHVEERRDWGSS